MKPTLVSSPPMASLPYHEAPCSLTALMAANCCFPSAGAAYHRCLVRNLFENQFQVNTEMGPPGIEPGTYRL